MLATVLSFPVQRFPHEKSYGETLLTQERDRLIALMATVRNTGSVAPHLYNVQEKIVQKKSGRTYRYAVLRHRDLKDRTLGKWNSESHQDWAKRIARRDAIREIEFRLERIDFLIARDAKSPINLDLLQGEGSDGCCD
jgi:hypothetical protein